MRHIIPAQKAIETYNLINVDPYALQLVANKIARKYGTNAATQIIINRSFKPGNGRVKEYTRFGWRKYTTGEYVPNTYRAKFGWKNTYYQHAECVVECNI